MVRIEEETIAIERDLDGKEVRIELTEEEIEEIVQSVRLEEADRMFIEYARELSAREQERISERIASPEQYDFFVFLAAEKQAELLRKASPIIFKAALADAVMG